MSLCRLLVLDFLHGVGRIDDDSGDERYDRQDLEFARDYADDRMEAGYIYDPVDGFRLEDFATWCRARLRGSRSSRRRRTRRGTRRRAG